MKKILIICKKDVIGNILREQLLKSLKGVKEVDNVDEADEIYVKYEEGKVVDFGKPTKYFSLDEKGKIIFIEQKENDSLRRVEFGVPEALEIKGVEWQKQAFDFLRFVVRDENTEFTTNETAGWTLFYCLGQLMFKELNYKFNERLIKEGLDKDEIETLKAMVRDATNYQDNKLSFYLRKFKYIYFRNSALLPNLGDNIFINCISLAFNDIWFDKNIEKSKSGKEVDLDKNKNREFELMGAINKTLKESTVGSSAFKRFLFGDNRGMYLLFIPDERLKDGEIMIPAPTFKQDIKGYPKIGKTVVATRHPITTLILKFKVVGYTDDGSVRTNSHTALALYGDADGDSQVVCFNPPKLNYSGVKELQEFRQVAGIEVPKIPVKCEQFNIDAFADVKPIEDKKKLYKSSIEQAVAKILTKEVTGALGVVERIVILTLIYHGIKIDAELLYQKSWLSQIAVQAKNILEALKRGEISELTKNTLILFVNMSQNTTVALKTVGRILGLTPEEARCKIVEWKTGIKPEIEKEVDELEKFIANAMKKQFIKK